MRVHGKGVNNGQQWVKMTFSGNDTGPLGVSLEVFLARSEAPWSRFDSVAWYLSLYHKVDFKPCMPYPLAPIPHPLTQSLPFKIGLW